jgi:hypothetical protein
MKDTRNLRRSRCGLIEVQQLRKTQSTFVLIRVVGGEVQMGPFGTAATDWPIVSAPSDYDDRGFGGMKIGKGNRSTRRKPGASHTLSTTNPA